MTVRALISITYLLLAALFAAAGIALILWLPYGLATRGGEAVLGAGVGVVLVFVSWLILTMAADDMGLER